VQTYQRSGLTFDVRDRGPAAGEPVLLLHGFPQDSSCWRLVEPLLHAAGLRTLAPDQRGYSPGARPRRRADYRGRELVGDVLALLDAAGLDSAHVVGHDWGGAVAWQLAGLHPARVRSLTVLSTPHPRALAAALRGRQARKSLYMLFFQLPVIPELILSRRLEAVLLRTGLPADFAHSSAARMAEPGALTAALNWYRAIPLGRGEPQPHCGVRTSYLWGNQDPFLGRRAAELTAGYVRAPYRFIELPAAHWLPETRPSQVATHIQSAAADF
jgi:pimeloyl-ACP methyl ester carboxylesterase